MAVRNIKSMPTGRVYIPTTAITYTKINIIDDDDTTWTVMNSYSGSDAENYTISASITRTGTEKISSFDIKIANINAKYLNKFNGGELVHFYADSTDATTHIFTGIMDAPKYGLSQAQGWTVSITGKEYPVIADKLISGLHAVATCAEALAKVFSDDYSTIKLQFWNGSAWATATLQEDDTVTWDISVTNLPTQEIDMVYQNKKGIQVVGDICNRTGIDGYIEYDISEAQWYFKSFVQNDIQNNTSNVAFGVNLLSINNYGNDTDTLYNRIRVFGATDGKSILLLKTEEDTDSQANFWIKDKIVPSPESYTMELIQEVADTELKLGIANNNTGSANTVLLHSLRPNQKIGISVPYMGVNGLYRIKSFTHNFLNQTTSISFNNTKELISDFLMPRINTNEIISGYSNVYDMFDSYTVYFNESPSKMESLVGAEEIIVVQDDINNGILQIVNAPSPTAAITMQGIATSETLVAYYDVTQCEFRARVNYFAYFDTYEVSNQGGASGTWDDITDKVKNGLSHTFDIPGRNLKFKIIMNRLSAASESPMYDSICLLYK